MKIFKNQRNRICHFCQRSIQGIKGSYCPYDDCGQYNGFQSDGSYDTVLPEQFREDFNPTLPIAQSLSPEPKDEELQYLCAYCQTQQMLKHKTLAQLTNLSPSDQMEIDKRFALCRRCASSVQQNIRENNRKVGRFLYTQGLKASPIELKLATDVQYPIMPLRSALFLCTSLGISTLMCILSMSTLCSLSNFSTWVPAEMICSLILQSLDDSSWFGNLVTLLSENQLLMITVQVISFMSCILCTKFTVPYMLWSIVLLGIFDTADAIFLLSFESDIVFLQVRELLTGLETHYAVSTVVCIHCLTLFVRISRWVILFCYTLFVLRRDKVSDRALSFHNLRKPLMKSMSSTRTEVSEFDDHGEYPLAPSAAKQYAVPASSPTNEIQVCEPRFHVNDAMLSESLEKINASNTLHQNDGTDVEDLVAQISLDAPSPNIKLSNSATSSENEILWQTCSLISSLFCFLVARTLLLLLGSIILSGIIIFRSAQNYKAGRMLFDNRHVHLVSLFILMFCFSRAVALIFIEVSKMYNTPYIFSMFLSFLWTYSIEFVVFVTGASLLILSA